MAQKVLTARKALLVASTLPPSGEVALDAVRGADPRLPALEVRLDGLDGPIDLPGLRAACPGRTLIATERSRAEGGLSDAAATALRGRLSAALGAGFDLVDVEEAIGGSHLLGLPPERVVVSRHDLDGVPEDLEGLVGRMRRSGARFVKVVGTPQTFGETLRLLEAQERLADGRTALFGMGELGLLTRALSPYLGAALSYGALDASAPTAPGQLAASDLLAVYGVGTERSIERLFAVLGSRVSRSLSPALHNGLFGALGLPALYVPASLVSFRDDLAALEGFLQSVGVPLAGASVTVPFKGYAAALVPCTGERAVNTLVSDADGRRAFNTDRLALLAAIPVARAGERALLLGAGGMAESAATSLVARGYALDVATRRPEAARLFAAHHGGRPVSAPAGDGAPPEAGGLQRAAGPYAVIVNTTPLGASAGDPLPCAVGLLGSGTLLVDSPYRPGGTDLVAEARARGCHVVDGFDLLVGQAASQASLFTGRAVTAEDLLRGLPPRLRALFAPPASPTTEIRPAAAGPQNEVSV